MNQRQKAAAFDEAIAGAKELDKPIYIHGEGGQSAGAQLARAVIAADERDKAEGKGRYATQAKHTPGPLYYRDGMIASESTGATVATVKNEADGHLYAAAPELLFYCKMALSLIDRYKDIMTGSESQCFRATAPVAIAKAEGRQ